ncbi:olfactory receptor 10A7-like [Pelodytes ibericus]
MTWENNTDVVEFILLGLSNDPKIQVILFFILLEVYMIILIGNSVIILATATDVNLQTPMYFFLINLSFLDICYSSTIVPRMLKDFLSVKKVISFAECAAQLYIAHSFGVSECILLAVMAYDRYVAICYPLHYTITMCKSVCIQIASLTWILGFVLSIFDVALTLNVDICGHNKINHFLCEVPEILSLGCENEMIVEFTIFVTGIIILMIPVTFIVLSYIKIIMAILKMSSSAGQQKTFSTCASHMMVVSLFYGSVMATYMKPRSSSKPGTDKLTAVFYLIITPMLNPLIYTLRNKDMKQAVKKFKTKYC